MESEEHLILGCLNQEEYDQVAALLREGKKAEAQRIISVALTRKLAKSAKKTVKDNGDGTFSHTFSFEE